MNSKNEIEPLSYEQSRDISLNIIKYHGVFYKFWDLVRPCFTTSKKHPTACVVFNRENECVDFLINKKFWSKLSQEQKDFIVCHECLHVILEHGKRACSITAKLNPNMVNACLDIPINEMLVKYFGFNRKNIDPKSKYCWADTVFKKQKLPNDQSYEFYFNRIAPHHRRIIGLDGFEHDIIQLRCGYFPLAVLIYFECQLNRLEYSCFFFGRNKKNGHIAEWRQLMF